MDTLLQDLRYALRAMGRNPALFLVALLTLALGIGASTAVFSVVDRILFRSLPYPDAERIVSFGMTAPIERNAFMISYDYVEWRHASVFESATAWTAVGDCDLTEQKPLRMGCARVESTFLPTFGVRPLLGRNFTPEENRPNAPKVALLTYGLWQSRFGGDPAALGKTISLDDQPTRVVGVLPASFELPNLTAAQVVLPMTFSDAELSSTHSTARIVRAFGRLKPGITAEQAQAALQPYFNQSMNWVSPQFRKEVKLTVMPLRDFQVRDSRLASWVLLAAVLAVLLIACANIANLLLARATARQRELAVRAALGAGRWRLARQAITESLALGIFGGLAGCALSYALLRVLIALSPNGIPHLRQAGMDARVLLFALLLSLASAVFFGLAPALQTPSPEALVGHQTSAATRGWFRQLLVAVQVAIAIVLLAGATLLLRTVWNLQSDPLGMQTSRVVIANLNLGQRYNDAQRMAFYDQLEQRLQRLPGVAALSLSDTLPPGGPMHAMVYGAILVRGRPRYMGGTGGMVAWREVTPQYFSALGVPIVQGRGFTDQDRNPDEHAAIFSQSLARKMFPGQDPLGQQLQPGLQGPWYTVVGVAADVKNGGVGAASDPEYYVVRRHTPGDAAAHTSVAIRTSMDADAMEQWMRGEITALDPTLPFTVETMDQRVISFVQRPRFNALVLSLFAAIGLLLAAIGVYGVVSFLVAQRTQEIGVRMALGATPGRILALVTSQGLRPVLLGAVAGLVAAVALARVLGSLLFEVRPRDPLTFAAAALTLAVVSFGAAVLPARRAARVDPMVALRHE